MADTRDMSEEEIAMIVALVNGQDPAGEDPLCKALEARGLVTRTDAAGWTFTEAGAAFCKERWAGDPGASA